MFESQRVLYSNGKEKSFPENNRTFRPEGNGWDKLHVPFARSRILTQKLKKRKLDVVRNSPKWWCQHPVSSISNNCTPGYLLAPWAWAASASDTTDSKVQWRQGYVLGRGHGGPCGWRGTDLVLVICELLLDFLLLGREVLPLLLLVFWQLRRKAKTPSQEATGNVRIQIGRHELKGQSSNQANAVQIIIWNYDWMGRSMDGWMKGGRGKGREVGRKGEEVE